MAPAQREGERVFQGVCRDLQNDRSPTGINFIVGTIKVAKSHDLKARAGV